jgi:HEAT repeat protein/ATP/ADP translocase
MIKRSIKQWQNRRILNLSRKEWQRVLPLFIVKLLFQTALVMGSSFSVALFMGYYSVDALPVFFVFQAIFAIIGTVALAGMLRRIPPSHMIMLASGFASLLLIFSSNIFEYNPALFFGILLLVFSVFLAQVGIWIALFIENLFSPLESERAFPVIEASEPLGGILAGFIMIALIGELDIEQLFQIIGFVLAGIPIFLFFSLKRLQAIPVLKVRRERRLKKRTKREFIINIRSIVVTNKYLMCLFFIIFFHFFAFHLVEYQFSKAIDMSVRTSENYTVGPQLQDSHDYEYHIIHHFGMIHVIIHTILLVLQILLASRLLRRFGVVNSMLISPLFYLVTFLVMAVRFTFMSAIISKGVYDVGGGLSRITFLQTFFAFSEQTRDEAKEILEGVARPLGLFVGTIALVVLQGLVAPELFSTAVSVMLVGVSLISIGLLLRLKDHYSSVSREKFLNNDDLVEKMNAIEILGQPGHNKSVEFLLENLRDTNQLPEVKVKILQVVGRLQATNAISDIVNCFHSKDYAVRLAAVKSLGKYTNLGKHFFEQAFSKHMVQSALKDLFLKAHSTSIKVAAMRVFANLKDPEIIPFLIKALKTQDDELLAECILVFGLFHDAGTIRHLTPFLSGRTTSRPRGAAVIALWQYEDVRPRAEKALDEMLNSKNDDSVISAIFTIGETLNHNKKVVLKTMLTHKNYRVRRHAAIAMAKLRDNDVVDYLVRLLFYKDKKIALKTKKLIEGVDLKIMRKVEERCVHEVSQRVTRILENAGTSFLENLHVRDLHELLFLFHLVDAEQEILKIRMILGEKGELEPVYA